MPPREPGEHVGDASLPGAAGPLRSTLYSLVRAAAEHVGARYAALGLRTPDGHLDRFVVFGVTAEDAAAIGRPPSGAGVLQVLADDPVSLRLDDLGTHPASVGFPPGHPAMDSFLGVPVHAGAAVIGHLYLTEKLTEDGFTAADEEAVVALAAAAGLAVQNALLAEAAQRRRAWAEAGTAVVTSLLSGTDPDRVLHEMAEQVNELAGADVCAVLTPREDDSNTFTVVAAAGDTGADAEGVQVPLAGTRLWEAHQAGTPVLLDEITAVAQLRAYAPVVQELMAAGYGYGFAVPIPGRPTAATLLAMRRLGRPAFTEEDLGLATAYATQVGLGVELARSHRREREHQVLADRERIARDLHDHVVQRIYATGLALDRVSRSLETDAPAAAAALAERVDELDETICRIRTAIFELYENGAGSTTDVRARLAEVVRSVTEGHDLRVDLRVRDASEDLPAGLVNDVVAVVRELVTNVVRHAGATRVTIDVHAEETVAVEVTDDGCGMPPVTARSGLANLADRANRRGGGLAVTAGPPGTAVRWAVPRP